jgi:hypothetical protein
VVGLVGVAASVVAEGNSLLVVVVVVVVRSGGMVLSWLERSSSVGRIGVAVVGQEGSHEVVVAVAEGMLSMMEVACSHMEGY